MMAHFHISKALYVFYYLIGLLWKYAHSLILIAGVFVAYLICMTKFFSCVQGVKSDNWQIQFISRYTLIQVGLLFKKIYFFCES